MAVKVCVNISMCEEFTLSVFGGERVAYIFRLVAQGQLIPTEISYENPNGIVMLLEIVRCRYTVPLQ